jgi:hypothetical protein
VSISDAETESGNDKNDASEKEEIEVEPEKHTKNTKYSKEDFIANKHGSEREPWVQNQCLFLIRNTNQRKKNTITSSVNG